MLQPESIFSVGEKRALIGAAGEVLASVGSTMDVARERLAAGVPDGYVVLAEEQTAGRGRTGAWQCPPGEGLLLSVVLKVGLPAREQKLIGIMGAVAAVEALHHLGVPASIKWPNDIVVARRGTAGLQLRKLGGVLVESVPRGDAAPAFVLGIGLNVNQSSEGLPPDAAPPAASMRTEAGRPFDRGAVCRALLRELGVWYRRIAMGQKERVLARWRQRNCLLGEPVCVRVGDAVLKGTVVGLRATGEIILQDGAGRQCTLTDQQAQLL